MARKPRLHVPGGLYHVIARGNDRQVLFRDAADYRAYLKRLETGLRRHHIRCYAYCLMPNHVHLLVEPGETPLGRLMQGLQGAYAQHLNRRYRRIGHRFQGRFRAILCEKEGYLLELVRYLHLNPVRAGLCRMPEGWPWCSHRAYMGSTEDVLPVVQTVVLGHFHRDLRQARRAFLRFVHEAIAVGHRPEFYKVWEQRVLGDETFAEQVLRPPRQEKALRLNLSVGEILEAVAEEFGIPVSAITSIDRTRVPARARAVAAFLARESANFSLTSVANIVRRDPVTISHMVQRLKERLQDTPQLRHQVERIQRRLRKGKGIE